MHIIWDSIKNDWLLANRGISFEDIKEKILNKEYLQIIENPSRESQLYFIMDIHDYTWIVPFLINERDQIVLKTAFRSRKFHKRFGVKK